MTLRPCVVCGEPSPTSRCPEHRLDTPKARPKGHVHTNTTRWKNASKRLRKLSPFCETCGAVEQLSVDHILPVSEAPELVYAEENLRVGCLSCNGKRGNRFTPAEAHTVLKRLESAYKRQPTKKGRERINVAQRLAQTRGGPPLTGTPAPSVGKI